MKVTDQEFVQALKDGKKVRRPSWASWFFMVAEDDGTLVTLDIGCMGYRSYYHQIDDFAADDWEIVNWR